MCMLTFVPGISWRLSIYNFLHVQLAQGYGRINLNQKIEEGRVEYPLSRDEHTAMTRYLSGVRKQLQDVSDLFTSRYGKDSSIAELAVKALVSATLLEHEFTLLDAEPTLPCSALESATSLNDLRG